MWRDLFKSCIISARSISIHSPHVRRDPKIVDKNVATKISIHSPRVRRDDKGKVKALYDANFNPVSSCEERREFGLGNAGLVEFQSTLLV